MRNGGVPFLNGRETPDLLRQAACGDAMRNFFTSVGNASGLRMLLETRGVRPSRVFESREFRIRSYVIAALFLIPAAWGLCFGLMFTLSRGGFSAPYDWMKYVAAPMADALAPFFPAIDNVTSGFHAHGYGERAEFGRCVAGMTIFFMLMITCMLLIGWLTLPNRIRARMALQNLQNINRLSSDKELLLIYVLCPLAGLAIMGYMAFEVGAGDLLIEWDSRPTHVSRMVAIHETDLTAGVTMFLGGSCGSASLLLLVLFDMIRVGIRKRRSGIVSGRGPKLMKTRRR